MRQTCGQRSGMAAAGLCMTLVLAQKMPLRSADFRRILRPTTFKNPAEGDHYNATAIKGVHVTHLSQAARRCRTGRRTAHGSIVKKPNRTWTQITPSGRSKKCARTIKNHNPRPPPRVRKTDTFIYFTYSYCILSCVLKLAMSKILLHTARDL